MSGITKLEQGQLIFGLGFNTREYYPSSSKAYKVWHSMLARCYSPKHISYPQYGGSSISVDPLWFDFQIFAVWHEEHYEQGCELDKDTLIKGNKIYGPSTCKYILPKFNRVNRISSYTKQDIDKAQELKQIGTYKDVAVWFNCSIGQAYNLVTNKYNITGVKK